MHPYNPSTQEAGQGYEFEASLDYQVTLLKRKGGREGESREGYLAQPGSTSIFTD